MPTWLMVRYRPPRGSRRRTGSTAYRPGSPGIAAGSNTQKDPSRQPPPGARPRPESGVFLYLGLEKASFGGAEGIRTPGPLDANEVRYRTAPQPPTSWLGYQPANGLAHHP